MDHLAHLQSDAALVVDVLRRTDAAAPVPGCPGWALGDLARHLGGIHRWATGTVVTGAPPATGEQEVADGELADWLAAGAADLLEALRRPERACWTLTGPGTSAFWMRRQALETAVHRVDAQRAAGLPHTVADELAEDGIAEVLDVMHPRQVALGRAEPVTGGVTLVTATTRQLGAAPAVTVRGPADAVLLLLWRRLPRTDPRLEVTGDLGALDRLLQSALTP